MNLDSAIAKHAEWKVKFRSAMVNGETLNCGKIARDNQCELGQWLHGEGRSAHGASPTFVDCVQKHAQFHQEAGKVAQAINDKRMSEAEAMLASGSDYSNASSAVGAALIKLKREVVAA